MKNIIWLIFLLVLTSCKTKDFSKEVVGNYEVSGWGGSTKPILTNSGKFHSEKALVSCLGSDWIDIVKGDYIVEEDYVILKPLTYHVQYYEYDKPVNRKLTWDSARSTSILRDFYDSLVIIGWKKKLFLVGANSATTKNPDEFISGGIRDFLNWIICGDTVNFQTHYLRKSCSSCIEENLNNALPVEWKNYLPTSEIKPKIIKADSLQSFFGEGKVLTYPLITIDAGKNQGVNLGYNFYSNNEKPRSIRIVEVNDNYSKGVSFIGKPKECQIGISLSTLKPKSIE